MVHNERLYMSSYLSIIVNIGISGHTIQILTCNTFVCNLGYIFERRFSANFHKTHVCDHL